MAYKLDIFLINADTLILTIIKGIFSDHSSLIWHIPISHFWGAVSVFSWQTLSRTAFPFNAILKPSALQFVCFRQAALDDVSFEKNPSGHFLHTVSLSGVPGETGKQCIQLHIISTVKKIYKNTKINENIPPKTVVLLLVTFPVCEGITSRKKIPHFNF